MCDCFRKQLYLHFVGNIIVTQLLRVSRTPRPKPLKLTLPERSIIITSIVPKAPPKGGAPTMASFEAIENLTILPAFHPRVFVELSPGVFPAGEKFLRVLFRLVVIHELDLVLKCPPDCEEGFFYVDGVSGEVQAVRGHD